MGERAYIEVNQPGQGVGTSDATKLGLKQLNQQFSPKVIKLDGLVQRHAAAMAHLAS